MPSESQIPIASQAASKQFATRLALFYGTTFGTVGTHLPFFTLWLKSVGIDAVLDRHHLPRSLGDAVHGASVRDGRWPEGAIRCAALLTVAAFATALGFAVIGTQYLPLAVLLAYAATCCLWTPMVPLTDAYALAAWRAMA